LKIQPHEERERKMNLTKGMNLRYIVSTFVNVTMYPQCITRSLKIEKKNPATYQDIISCWDIGFREDRW
jgi:hypothetical protein